MNLNNLNFKVTKKEQKQFNHVFLSKKLTRGLIPIVQIIFVSVVTTTSGDPSYEFDVLTMPPNSKLELSIK